MKLDNRGHVLTRFLVLMLPPLIGATVGYKMGGSEGAVGGSALGAAVGVIGMTAELIIDREERDAKERAAMRNEMGR